MKPKTTIKLDRNADITSLTELAEYLLDKIADKNREAEYNVGNDLWLTRLSGQRATLEMVLSAIGYEEKEG